MKTTVLVLALLTLTVGLAGAATAQPDGFGRCEIVWEDFAMVWGTGTPLDGTEVDRPMFECYW
jgi:hypothetical protein